MKKILTTILSVAMIGITCLNVSAETVTSGSTSKDVNGTYKAGKEAEIVYSVDVSWGSMEFTYTGASEGDWDPSKHEYVNPIPAAWSCEENANKINVTNHSNTAITADLVYTAESSYSGITGSFSKNKLELATAVGTAKDSAPSDAATLSLAGELANSVTEKSKIGAIKITIS